MSPLTELRSKHIRELLRNPKARRGDSEFVVEGPHLLEAALEKVPKLVLYVAATAKALNSHPALAERVESLDIPMYSLSPKGSERITDAKEPQGWFAVLRMPRPRELKGDVVVALDGVQDPGNVGTVIRSAAWFGVETVLLGDGTADPFAPKVVRSTQGALFEMNLETSVNLTRRLPELRDAGRQIVAATVDESAVSAFEATYPKQCVLLFGTEGQGINPELLSLASSQVMIPRFGVGESLNVAISAAIVLAELRRKG